jgi:hypothetical protein
MGTAFALDGALELGAWECPASDDAPRLVRPATRVAPWRRWLGRKLGA